MILCVIADARSIHTQRWAAYFAKRGHTVHLITYDPSGVVIPGVTEHLAGSRWQNMYLSFWPRHFKIIRLVRQIKPDLIHAHFITKYGFHLPLLGNYPKIVSAWGDDILILPQSSRLLFYFTRFVLESVDIIYAISEDIRSHIIQDYRMPPKKVKYLPFGVETEIFLPSAIERELKNETIVFFSNRGFLPIYGMDIIVAAFEKAYREKPDIRLILKGDGPDKNKLKTIINKKKLSDVVKILDITDYSGVPQDLKGADVFISIAGRDGTPVSLLEAMATGLPSIASSVGGIPEWITDDVNGILIPPNNPDILAQKMVMLSDDSGKRNKLGENARKTILERGNWTDNMRKAERDYKELIKTFNPEKQNR